MTATEEARTPGQGEPVTILYTNYRGETAVRRIAVPTVVGQPGMCMALWFGSNDWHPEPQWLLSALDVEKDAARDFALSGIKAWGQAAVDAALATAPSSPGVPDSVREALEFYADGSNYQRGAAMDPNSGHFEGATRACAALKSISTHPTAQSTGQGAEHQRDMALEALHTLGVRLGVLDPSVACDGPQLLTAMDAYSESLPAPDSTRTGPVGTEKLTDAMYRAAEGWVRGPTRDKFLGALRALSPEAAASINALATATAEATSLRAEVEAVLDDATRMSSLLLMAGEMTAQERRTARAVAEGIAAKIRTALARAATAWEG